MAKRIQSPGLALAFSADEIETARREGRLLSLDIELTKLCNLRCVYCYANSSKKSKGELQLSEVYQIINEAKDLGLKTLNLTGGEPLLHEGYFQIAKYAYEHDITILLFTNGTLLTKSIANKLMDFRISPCIKLDSLSPIIQDCLTGKEGSFQEIQKGISNLIDVGYTSKYPVLSVNAVICRLNISSIPELWTWARTKSIIPSLTRLQPMGRAKENMDLVVTPEELYELYSQISRIDETFGIHWEPTLPWVHGKSCRRHYIGCFIDCYGNVQPCSGVPIKLGNIRERSLKEILASSEVIKVARNMEKYLEGACSKCKNRAECYGCRSIAYSMTGSFTAADLFCWLDQKLSDRLKVC